MMAKRHHSSMHGHHEEHSKRKHHSSMHGHYEGHADRKHQEHSDGGMITEDHNAIANMPQEVMMKPYRMAGSYLPEDLDDKISGIDRQIDFDDSKRREHFHPKKV